MIVDHVFRPSTDAPRENTGTGRTQPFRPLYGSCVYLGTCGRPADDHITVSDFRARRAAR